MLIFCYNAVMDASHPHRTFAVSLIFDEPSSEEISSARRKLSSATGGAHLAGQDAPPHITLGMFHAMEESLDEVGRLFGDFTKDAPNAFRADFSGTDFFKDKVIFLSI